MTKYIELIDKYEIRQSDSDEYNPPSYIWRDNTGELIRCKDCKYFREPNDAIKTSYCWYHAEDVNPEEDYCSWAERREDDQTD